ncbi:MAG TPA: HEAT repeat domain-containing protein, partial [Bryobacteraceae bacterium]|nr:HEAT repeat domain-containing protein [Bryobacteraceae bacterium]
MRKLWILVLLAPGSLLTASGQEFAFAQRARQENVQDVNYQRGQSALDAHRWDQALAAFNQAVEAAGPRTDAALYWKAYSLEKLGRRGDALATLAQLRQAYASSKWLDDARALELEMRQASGQKVNPDAEPDEDLKLMAINGLLNTDPARALPVLEKLISSSGSPKLKERALFVLAQSGAPQSKEILGRIARGGSNPDLQLKAVNFLGVMGSPENRKLLAEIYTSSSDMKVKRAVLQAYLVSGDRQRLLELAKGEKDPALRMDAIHHLGVSGGQSELWQLYQAEPSIDVKEKILKSMFVGG